MVAVQSSFEVSRRVVSVPRLLFPFLPSHDPTVNPPPRPLDGTYSSLVNKPYPSFPPPGESSVSFNKTVSPPPAQKFT